MPFLEEQSTSPQKLTKFQKIKYYYNKFIGKQADNWVNLYKMLDKRGGYWESSGKKLTVYTTTPVITDRLSSYQLFKSNIIILYFPPDIAQNETVTFTGIRRKFYKEENVDKKLLDDYIGQLKV